MRRVRGSLSMCTSSTHAAQMLTPSVRSMMALHTALSESICCGTTLRIVPISSSLCANARIESSRLCEHRRVGSACGSRRALLVTKSASASSRRGAPTATSSAVGRAVVAAGLLTGTPRAAQMAAAAPSAAATAVVCAACAADRSPRLLRVVCCPPPIVFLGFSTREARTLVDRMPPAARCAASSGSCGSYDRKDASRAFASMGRWSEKRCDSLSEDVPASDLTRGPASSPLRRSSRCPVRPLAAFGT